MPKTFLYEFQHKLKKKNHRKIICIDNKINCLRTLNLIPFIKNINQKNFKSGKKFLILDHDLIKYEDYKSKNKNETIVLSGGSGLPNEKVIKYFKKLRKIQYIFLDLLLKIKI